MEESDEEFAARMRARRGEPPPRRVPAWRQLMDLSIANVHDTLFNPGVVSDDGVIEETIGVDVLSPADAANAYEGSFAVQTLKVLPDGDYEHFTVERRVKRVNITGPGVAWMLNGEQQNGWLVAEFKTALYEATVKSIGRDGRLPNGQGSFDRWAQVIENGLLVQHTSPEWRTFDRLSISWRVERAEIDDDGMRGIFTLHKMQSWIDHDGKLATPWGSINCAEQPPVIVEGSELDRIISQQQRDGRAVSIPDAVWFAGLKMPSFDHDRVRRILAAQKVIVEVPLVT